MQESNKPVLNTDTPKAATNFGESSHHLKFDHFMLQGHYGGSAGWDDLTADNSLDAILTQESTYKENEPNIPYRVVSVWKYVSTGKEKRYLVKRESALRLFV